MSEVKTTALFAQDGKVIERRTQDVEPVLQYAADLRAVGATGSSEMKHAARIPFALIENYL